MLIAGIAVGLLLGLFLGGKIERLADIRLKFLPLLFAGVILRFATEAAIVYGVDLVGELRLPLFGLAYGLLLFTLWENRGYPGMALAFVGVASNALVIMVNGGYMPVWLPAYQAAGLGGPLGTVLHVPLPPTLGAEFLLRLGPLADLIPLPIPPLNNVASIGDLFLTAGLSFFLFSTVLTRAQGVARGDRPGQGGAIDGRRGGDAVRWRANGRPRRPGRRSARRSDRRRHRRRAHVVAVPAGRDRLGGRAASGHRPLPRPRGGIGPRSGPSCSADAASAWRRPPRARPSQAIALDAVGVVPIDVGVPVARPSRLEGIRQHPYIRLALNGSFSALWVGQVISLFGDRVNQLALIAFVFEITDSPTAVAVTFLVSTIPNLIFSPVAGTLVDRWDQKQVLVVSDLLRAALVLLVPVAVLINVWLAYPLVFLITTVSIFFRPARVAILPRIVDEGDLLSANSAMWVGETIADVINYPIAGLFVVFLASSLPLAFWFDAVTYLGSAVLLATIVVPPIVKRARRTEDGEATQVPRTTWQATGSRTPSRASAWARSGATSASAGSSCATRRCCWRTRSRARSASSPSACSRSRASCWRSRSRRPRATSTGRRTRSWRRPSGSAT